MSAMTPREAAERIDRYLPIDASHDLYEQLAAVQHDIWAHWMRYLLGSKIRDVLGTSDLALTIEDVEHWRRQADTPYADLSEREKASDREQVERYWPLVAHCYPGPTAPEVVSGAEAAKLPGSSRVVRCDRDGLPYVGYSVREVQRENFVLSDGSYRVLYRGPTPA